MRTYGIVLLDKLKDVYLQAAESASRLLPIDQAHQETPAEMSEQSGATQHQQI